MKPAASVKSVAVIGNGLMGQGISQVFARAGINVSLIGRNVDSLERAMTAIRGNFEQFVTRDVVGADEAAAAIARITTSIAYEDAGSADHVIEAVPAVRELQIEVFSEAGPRSVGPTWCWDRPAASRSA